MASTIICQFNQLFSNSEKYPTSLEKHNVFLLIPSFIVILFVLFGGSVGAVVFLHTQYGWEAVKQVLGQEMTRSVAKYREENRLTKQFWDWVQVSVQISTKDMS